MMISAQSLAFGYGRSLVLKGLSLDVRRGEFLGLLGPNGSGKSTLLKAMLGYLRPSSGALRYWDSPRSPGRGELAKRLGYVPQHSAQHRPVSVRDAVLMGRLPHLRDRWAGYGPADRKAADGALDELGMRAFADRELSQLSGGEFQRVTIARALAQESDIILLDEATSGLDLNHAVEIMELMRDKVDQEGVTVVAVLHDLNLAAQFCDRIALLKDGAVRYLGGPEEVLNARTIEEVYGIRAEVRYDPSGRPMILPCRARDCASGCHACVDPAANERLAHVS